MSLQAYNNVLKSAYGPPRKLNDQNILLVGQKLISGEYETASSACKELENNLGVYVSESTLPRNLNKLGLKSGEKVVKPKLKAKHIKERKEFIKRYVNWTMADWHWMI